MGKKEKVLQSVNKKDKKNEGRKMVEKGTLDEKKNAKFDKKNRENG